MFYFPAKGKEERKQAGGKGDEDEKDQTAVHRDAGRFDDVFLCRHKGEGTAADCRSGCQDRSDPRWRSSGVRIQ